MTIYTKKGLHFYREGNRPIANSKLDDIPDDLQVEDEDLNLQGKALKVGASLLTEHHYKMVKMNEVRDWICHHTKHRTRLCSRGCQQNCLTSFKDCLNQEQSIWELRKKFFHPSVSKKGRRSALDSELESMIEVSRLFSI